jgi:hypothetical protein
MKWIRRARKLQSHPNKNWVIAIDDGFTCHAYKANISDKKGIDDVCKLIQKHVELKAVKK